MAHSGQVFDDGTVRMEFVTTATESAGDLHEMRVTYAPNSPFPPAHLHPAQDEHFEVLEGEMEFIVDGHERTVEAGGSIDVPRGTVHQVRNPGSAPATVIWQTRPALRTGEFFEAIAEAQHEGIEALLRVVEAFDDVFVLGEQPTPG